MNRLVLCAAMLIATGAAQAITNTAPVVPIAAAGQPSKATGQQATELQCACQAIAGARVVDGHCIGADGRAVSRDALKQAAAKASDGNG